MTASLKDAIEQQVDEIRLAVSDEGRATGFCIGNTAKSSPIGWFLTPVRHAPSIVAGSIIVYSDDLAVDVARILDGIVDYIFVDAEKKIRRAGGSDYVPNPERVVRENIKRSRVLTYKGNDLVVDAVDTLLSQLCVAVPRGIGGKTVAVVGAGNVGSKVALRLVERGAKVRLFRRSREVLAEIVDGLNRIVPAGTTAQAEVAASAADAMTNADIVIGATDGTAAIDSRMIESLAPGAIIVEAGKGSIDAKAIEAAITSGRMVLRVDVRAAFAGYAETILRTERAIENGLQRRSLGDVAIVGAGVVGLHGDIVVDNARDPRAVFGIADGTGDFVRNPGPALTRRMSSVKEWIEQNRRGART